jgi:phosphoadenosine phosphosulfate reductase
MKVVELMREVKAEVIKPFPEKLERSITLIKLFARTKVYVSCSGGKDSLAVLHLALKYKPEIPVAWINTGVDFPETQPFLEELSKKWNFDLHIIKPKKSYWQILDDIKRKGMQMDDGSKDSNTCCYHLKERPFLLWIREMGLTHCFTGVTAMESRHRMITACQKGMDFYQRKQEVWKIMPIIYWQPQEVWAYIREHEIPVHPAYAKYNLERIGCIPCTSYKKWREQLQRINPKMYKLLQEKYFGQKLIDSFS